MCEETGFRAPYWCKAICRTANNVTIYFLCFQPDDMRMKYMKLKDTNEHLLRQLESSQQELDNLNMKKGELEEELAMSPVKQEAGTVIYASQFSIFPFSVRF